MTLPGFVRKALPDSVAELCREIYTTALTRSFRQTTLPPRSEAELPKLAGLRIALLKQDTYSNLYIGGPHSSPAALLQSSIKHTGPFALFSLLNADFYVIRQFDAPECYIWQEKIYHCRQGSLQHFNAIRDHSTFAGVTQAQVAVEADSVNWSAYDIVISVDIAIPEQVTSRHPSVLWAYYISEPCMPSYRYSRGRPIAGYDVFLNQRFDSRQSLKSHEINFPFALQRSGCFDHVVGASASQMNRDGCFIESHTVTDASLVEALRAIGPIRTVVPNSESIVRSLYSSKYFVRCGGRMMWGNAMIEAVACGCVAVGISGEFKNRSLFTADTSVSSKKALLTRLQQFEDDGAFYDRVLAEQRARLDHFCYWRPMKCLVAKLREKRQ